MRDVKDQFIDIAKLQIGMFVYIDLGWTEHPFPLGSFKIQSREQIKTIQELKLKQIRYSPAKSDPDVVQEASAKVRAMHPAEPPVEASQDQQRLSEKQKQRQALLEQQAGLDVCERQFDQAAQALKQVFKAAGKSPGDSKIQAEGLVDRFLQELTTDQDVAIRLLSEKALGDSSLHPINVTVIALLLGKSWGLEDGALQRLGMGALLHDIGKTQLPERLHWGEEGISSAERTLYRKHVAQGVEIGRRMGLDREVLGIIYQHHEYVDGSGYPRGVDTERMMAGSKILSIVNHYDNLCNSAVPAKALTPHDALALMFARTKSKFDKALMTLFIRMMGVYPPGSVVQLSDDSFALVTTVNSVRPLKPQVLVYDPHVPQDDAIHLDLETLPDLGIKRSIQPQRLSQRVYGYLSPRKRVCYFFQRVRGIPGGETGP